jgi:metal transporter CNNM
MLFGLDETESLIFSISVIAFITIVAGCVSGLTLSLFSIDETYLKVLADGPEGPDKRRAQNVLAVTASPHWLLVTLLLTNAAAIESMPMIIDSILNPIAAICISVVLVLVFGEVIPQALFIRHALPIGSFFSLPLRCLMWATSPISWTVAKILDAVVGHREAVFFRRRELREFLVLQQEMLDQPLLSDDDHDDRRSDAGNPARILAAEMKQKISEQEISIMLGALSLSETMVEDVLKTKLEDVVSLSETTVVDKNQCERLFLCGFSRILVHKPGHPEHITGFFLTKMLIKLIYRTQERAPTVKDLAIMEAHVCSPYDLLSEVYQALQLKSCHLAVVCEDSDTGNGRKALGIITSHDILEFIHRCSFSDETDMRNGAPLQLLVKSWYQMKFRKQVMESATMFGGSGIGASGPPSSGGGPSMGAMHYNGGTATFRGDIFSSPGLGTSAQWDQSPASHNRSFSRIMATRHSGIGRQNSGVLATQGNGPHSFSLSRIDRNKTGEREMMVRKPGSPTTSRSHGVNTSGYGSL